MMLSKLIVAFVAFTSAGPAAADAVRVFGTGVYASSLHDLAAPFKAATGHDLAITIANAGGVAAKVEAGEPADVVMTSSAGVDALVRKGKLVAATKIDVGRMRLGVGVKAGMPMPEIRSIDDVRALLLAAPAVAYIDPKGGATSGAFFEKMFELLGIADAIRAKGVPCADGADVDAAITAGKATVGMTQGSELIGAPGVAFAGFLPDALNVVTVYSAALTGGPGQEAAKAFLDFATGPVGAARLKSAGWELAKPAP